MARCLAFILQAAALLFSAGGKNKDMIKIFPLEKALHD
jgi:hypothetical protein